MTEPTFTAGYSDVDDVAARIVEDIAEGNNGIVEVVPVDTVEDHLTDAVANADAVGDDEWEDLVVATKDALLSRDYMIA